MIPSAVQQFARQAQRFASIASSARGDGAAADDQSLALAMGQCLATICYGQLIAENAVRLKVPNEILSAIFHLLVLDLGACGMLLARRMSIVPQTTAK